MGDAEAQLCLWPGRTCLPASHILNAIVVICKHLTSLLLLLSLPVTALVQVFQVLHPGLD